MSPKVPLTCWDMPDAYPYGVSTCTNTRSKTLSHTSQDHVPPLRGPATCTNASVRDLGTKTLSHTPSDLHVPLSPSTRWTALGQPSVHSGGIRLGHPTTTTPKGGHTQMPPTKTRNRKSHTPDNQPGLWDLPTTEPASTTTPKKGNTRPNIGNHHLGLPKPARNTCNPQCVTCKRPEGAGLCHQGCATTCGPAPTPRLIEICLITTTVTATHQPGRPWATLTCPHCHRTHWHRPTAPGRRYRTGQCGRPYIAITQDPRP